MIRSVWIRRCQVPCCGQDIVRDGWFGALVWLLLAFAVGVFVGSLTLHAQGIVKRATDTTTRPVLTGAAAGVPATRGAFIFAPPYGTQGPLA